MQTFKIVVVFVDGYPPLASTCFDFYKLGIVPQPYKCLNLTDNSSNALQCCWNNLIPSNQVLFELKYF